MIPKNQVSHGSYMQRSTLDSFCVGSCAIAEEMQVQESAKDELLHTLARCDAELPGVLDRSFSILNPM